MNDIAENSKEQKLIIAVFDLIGKLGYEDQENYDKVKITETGTFRLIVYQGNNYFPPLKHWQYWKSCKIYKQCGHGACEFHETSNRSSWTLLSINDSGPLQLQTNMYHQHLSV